MDSELTPRLGFLITNLAGGGAERVVSTLADELSDHRRDLLLFDETVVYPFDGNVHLVDIPLLEPDPPVQKLWQMMTGLLKLHRQRQQLDLDVCISFLTWPNLFNILSSSDDKIIISVRNNPSHALRGPTAPLLKFLVRVLYPRADHIVAISEDVRRNLVEDFGVAESHITTIYNPIQLDDVRGRSDQPLPDELADLAEVPTVVSVGRLAVQKGQWHLIRAFDELQHRIDNSRLLILGIGPFQDYLVELATGLGLDVWVHDRANDGPPLEHDVIFWGFADNPFPILTASSLFAFPSLWEGLGNVIIESLACELPVVSADCRSGPREILAPDTPLDQRTQAPEWADYGVLMPVCDGQRHDHTVPLTEEEKLWTDVMARLLEDPETHRHYARRGRDRASDFDLPDITRQWRRLLDLSATA